MLFLLPPSESKADGAYPGAKESSLCIEDVALAFGALNPARDLVADALIELCSDTARAAEVFKISPKRAGELEANTRIRTAPTMFAIDRYNGTLFDAIHGRGLKGTPTEFAHLDPDALTRAQESVLIQSALFGLIPATARIPNYRLSASTRLPDANGRALNLKEIWQAPHDVVFHRLNGLIIDMRSKSYADLAPIPDGIEHFTLDVALREQDGTLTKMNHFNKKYKGQLVRSCLMATTAPKAVADLVEIAQGAGFELQVKAKELLLVVPHA